MLQALTLMRASPTHGSGGAQAADVHLRAVEERVRLLVLGRPLVQSQTTRDTRLHVAGVEKSASGERGEMMKRKSSGHGKADQSPSIAIDQPSNLFAQKNRGMLLDVLIFLANLFLMRLLVRLFLNISRQASAGDVIAQCVLLLFYLGMLLLPLPGAILKRWHFHQRIKRLGEAEDDGGCLPFGCFFLPFVYLAVNMFMTLAVSLTLLELFPDSSLGGAFLLFGLPYSIFQTVIVFRYFSPPKREPKSDFLRDPRSEVLGDACIFLNMVLYQVLLNWAALSYPGFHEGKFVDRFFPLIIFALLMYLSGRIFFLVEDIRHPRTWLTILLANSIIILRALFDAR
jgi:hypothetical protein